MTEVRAECTWGEGPDVLVVVTHTNGNIQYLDLTAEETVALSKKLIGPAAQAEELDKVCLQHDKLEKS